MFATNVLAPNILTALVRQPQRPIYLSSGLHRGTTAQLDDVFWRKRCWDGGEAYSETKLYETMLAFCDRAPLARRFLKRAGTGMGAHKDERFGITRRHQPGSSHASVAHRERRSAGDGTISIATSAKCSYSLNHKPDRDKT
jgi:hypothetical protein